MFPTARLRLMIVNGVETATVENHARHPHRSPSACVAFGFAVGIIFSLVRLEMRHDVLPDGADVLGTAIPPLPLATAIFVNCRVPPIWIPGPWSGV